MALCHKTPTDDIPGFTRREDGRFIHTPDSPPMDLTGLPLPDYDAIDLDHYTYPLLGKRTALLETTRGCSFSCTFCLKTMYGKGVREKSFAQVADEIEYLLAVHKPGSIYFIDLEFTLKRKMALHVCSVLRRWNKKIPWACQTRADLVDPELLREMAASGCRLIHYGIESGNQKILDAANKKINLEAIEAAIRQTRQAGIETACFFLFGFPGETRHDMEDTIRFAKKLNPDFASFHIVTPYPQTPLNEFALSGNKFERYCKSGLPPADIEKLVRRAYVKFYIRPGYMVHVLLKRKPSLWLKQLKLFKEFIGL
jgi:anaerobic magnesium-protoporphyrin IX monomethyl ester cyclase